MPDDDPTETDLRAFARSLFQPEADAEPDADDELDEHTRTTRNLFA